MQTVSKISLLNKESGPLGRLETSLIPFRQVGGMAATRRVATFEKHPGNPMPRLAVPQRCGRARSSTKTFWLRRKTRTGGCARAPPQAPQLHSLSHQPQNFPHPYHDFEQ